MAEFILFYFAFNILLLSVITWFAFRTNLMWYRKWKGGTWFLIIDEYILDTNTDTKEQIITRWTRGKVRKDLILKTEIY